MLKLQSELQLKVFSVVFNYTVTLFSLLNLKIINPQYKHYSAILPAPASGVVVALLTAEIITCYPSNNSDDTNQTQTLTDKELEIKKKKKSTLDTTQ